MKQRCSLFEIVICVSSAWRCPLYCLLLGKQPGWNILFKGIVLTLAFETRVIWKLVVIYWLWQLELQVHSLQKNWTLLTKQWSSNKTSKMPFTCMTLPRISMVFVAIVLLLSLEIFLLLYRMTWSFKYTTFTIAEY